MRVAEVVEDRLAPSQIVEVAERDAGRPGRNGRGRGATRESAPSRMEERWTKGVRECRRPAGLANRSQERGSEHDLLEDGPGMRGLVVPEPGDILQQKERLVNERMLGRNGLEMAQKLRPRTRRG